MTRDESAVVKFLAAYPPEVRRVALELRRTVLGTIPDGLEMVDSAGKVIGYGFGSGYADLICTIIPSQKGVKLGIVGAAHLPDPDRLLEGTGKRHRYVALKGVADARRPGLEALLEAAVGEWKKK
jgi:hypothetical protein